MGNGIILKSKTATAMTCITRCSLHFRGDYGHRDSRYAAGLVTAVAAVVLLHNVGYLDKERQPISGPRCYPLPTN